jgi:hypothetical protein
MDERVEAFLADILALEGDEANAIRQGVRGVIDGPRFPPKDE